MEYIPEGITIAFLASEVEYEVPPQNLELNLAKVPTVLNSRFVNKNVSFKASPAEVTPT
jgi:hypothetical protein